MVINKLRETTEKYDYAHVVSVPLRQMFFNLLHITRVAQINNY